MRRFRTIAGLTVLSALTLLALAPAALAHGGGGEGWYGPTTDASITSAMFLVIIFFPTLIVLFSVLQWRLDRRKHARLDAVRRRAANADWRGGW